MLTACQAKGRWLVRKDLISVPRHGEIAVLRHFQAQLPDGLFVSDAQS